MTTPRPLSAPRSFPPFLAVLALAALAASPAPSASEETEVGEAPTITLVLVRHAERFEDGTRDPGLTARGHARARCLAAHLARHDVSLLVASPFRRTQETLAPLAERTGLPVLVRDPLDTAALACELAAADAGTTAVLAGHSDTLPMLAAELGIELDDLVVEHGREAIPRGDHGRMIRIVLRAGDAPPSERVVSVEQGRQPCGAAERGGRPGRRGGARDPHGRN